MMNRQQTIRDLANALSQAEENGVLHSLAMEMGNDAVYSFVVNVDKLASEEKVYGNVS